MRVKLIVGASLVLISGACALTREEAIERALKAHPDIRLLQEDIVGAQAQKEVSGLGPVSEVSGGPSLTRSSSEEGARYGGKLNLGYARTFEFPGKKALRMALAEGDVQVKVRSLAALRSQMGLEIRQAFLQALVDREAVVAQTGIRAHAQTVLELVRRRQEAGLASDFEMLRVEAELSEALVAEAGAIRKEQESRRNLSVWSNASGDTALALEGRLEDDTGGVAGDVLSLALRGNPALEILDLRIAQARKAADGAKLNARPDLTVRPSAELGREEQVLSLEVSVPLVPGARGRTEEAVARSQWRRLELERESVRRDLESRVRAALAGVAASKELLALCSRERLVRLDELLKRAEAGYAHGTTSLVSLLDARRARIEALARHREALAGLAQATLQLKACTVTIKDAETADKGDVR